MPMPRFKTVDAYIKSLSVWKDEVIKLREIVNSTELVEELKWGSPCYTINGRNVVGLAAFNDYFGLWFFHGVFMKDDADVLINTQEGKTRGMRQWRFSSAREMKVRLIKAYLKEAIELSKAKKEIKPQRGKPVIVPDELMSALAKNKKAKNIFDEMTIGKQREYAEYISDAKRLETRVKRLAKILPMIKEGVGLNDKYRK